MTCPVHMVALVHGRCPICRMRQPRQNPIHTFGGGPPFPISRIEAGSVSVVGGTTATIPNVKLRQHDALVVHVVETDTVLASVSPTVEWNGVSVPDAGVANSEEGVAQSRSYILTNPTPATGSIVVTSNNGAHESFIVMATIVGGAGTVGVDRIGEANYSLALTNVISCPLNAGLQSDCNLQIGWVMRFGSAGAVPLASFVDDWRAGRTLTAAGPTYPLSVQERWRETRAQGQRVAIRASVSDSGQYWWADNLALRLT